MVRVEDIEKALDSEITFALNLVKRYAVENNLDDFKLIQRICTDQLLGMRLLLQDILPWNKYGELARKINVANGRIHSATWKGGAA